MTFENAPSPKQPLFENLLKEVEECFLIAKKNVENQNALLVYLLQTLSSTSDQNEKLFLLEEIHRNQVFTKELLDIYRRSESVLVWFRGFQLLLKEHESLQIADEDVKKVKNFIDHLQSSIDTRVEYLKKIGASQAFDTLLEQKRKQLMHAVEFEKQEVSRLMIILRSVEELCEILGIDLSEEGGDSS